VHRSSRHSGALAARTIPTVLGAAFKQIGKNWAASRQFSDSHVDSYFGASQSLVARAPHSWRTEEARNRVLRTVRRPPSQSWRTFLQNHVGEIVAVDFFTVPTIRLRVLFVFLIIEHRRRRVLHFGITEHPTAEWTAQQVNEAFSERDAKRYVIRDRDSIYGHEFRRRIQSLGVKEVVTAPRSPWQNACVERLIGSIRRECLDQVVVLSQRHLRRLLKSYFAYYQWSRTHLALAKDAPEPRAIMRQGEIIAIPQVGGLHHRYERRAA